MLPVLSILYISVCLQVRWLSGNAEDLGDYDFGVMDMGTVVDTLASAMEDVADNGELFLDEEYMMNIFSDLQKIFDPFDEYLTYISEEKSSNRLGEYSKTLIHGGGAF
jgi:hypothetical protein